MAVTNVKPVLVRLFDACVEDVHYEVLEDLCFRAGLLWRCASCQYNSPEDSEVCHDCGKPRQRRAVGE